MSSPDSSKTASVMRLVAIAATMDTTAASASAAVTQAGPSRSVRVGDDVLGSAARSHLSSRAWRLTPDSTRRAPLANAFSQADPLDQADPLSPANPFGEPVSADESAPFNESTPFNEAAPVDESAPSDEGGDFSQHCHRNMQIVVKVSKLCNLRCAYCYEYPELGDRAVMSREQLAAMYRTLADYVRARDAADRLVTRLDFIWHGGEPLVQPPRLYWETFADQEEIFGDAIPYRNAVQTNLTRLDGDRFDLLANGFTGVGVSLDVTGGLRVDRAGRNQQPKVVRNLERLLEAGQRVGCVTVLSARNVDDVERTFRFYEERALNFRVLPLFDTGERSQTTPFELSLRQELDALARFVDLWLAGESAAAPPAPLSAYVHIAARHLAGAEGPRYRDRREWLPLILVNTDGGTFTYGEPYGDPAWSIGNVFTDSFPDMLAGERFERCAVQAERRVARNCLTCPFFDACGGSLVAETEMRERDHDGDGTLLCTARPVIGYIVDQLKQRAPDLVDAWQHPADAQPDPDLAAA